jgi:hypothetical protein
MDSIHDIVEKSLRDNGHDGLYCAGECACRVGDLMPCDTFNSDCKPGYLLPCDCGEHDWHIGEEEETK